MPAPIEDPLYYLANFQRVLDWVGARYADLLTDQEQAFLEAFPGLPAPSRALLVRMAMRKGALFRLSRLVYGEIGCPRQAVAALVERGWVDPAPALELAQLFALSTKTELLQRFAADAPGLRALPKDALLAALATQIDATPRPFAAWPGSTDDGVVELRLDPLCERLRLMFFGNLRQDWSEFVLADLGIYRYESVAFDEASRGFASRADVDDYLALQRVRERFAAGEAPAALLDAIRACRCTSAWLAERRGKLLFRLARQLEREQDWDAARALYDESAYPGARLRGIRMLERSGRTAEALQAAERAAAAPQSEAERQQLARSLPRLQRRLGLPAAPHRPPRIHRFELCLAFRPPVEHAVRDHLATPEAPVFYVENGLLGSLFGLLCWEAIFAALPGAFFHPFHAAPADLLSPDFRRRRAALFAGCLACLDDGRHAARIRATYRAKFGLQSPFVAWNLLDPTLLELALACIPPAHLKLYFSRLLDDLGSNRAGLPDLIQFWPAEGRYRMIEVKGPGDRLQDNQLRWLAFCAAHGLPVSVCHLSWEGAP